METGEGQMGNGEISADALQGRYIVTGAIGVTIALALILLSFQNFGLSPASAVFVLLSLSLYDGQSWARWVLGVLLFLFGASWSIQSAVSFSVVGLKGLPVFFVLVALGALVAGPALLFSSQVREFMRNRKSNRNVLVHKTLLAVWLLAAVVVASLIVWDIVK